jgi:transcriptional regulator of acetoin/glycerol metabolism
MTSRQAALPAGTDPRAMALRLHAAREGFLSTGLVDATMRRLVIESWQRCLDRGIEPHVGATVDWSDAELAAYRDAHPLAAAMPVIRRLLVEDARDAGFIVALTDAGGRLLWVEGAHAQRSQAEGIGFVEGATWSEDAAGTNAPGTALALDQPVQIFAAEHLARSVTPWSCSAAPIHAPDGRLLGAIDLTGGDEVAAPHNLTLVRTAAAAIEAELRLRPHHQPRRSRTASARTSTRQLRVLGRPSAELVIGPDAVPLRLRHAEILFLLTLSPDGLTAEQLAIELHDRTTAPVTLRAELSRLRELLARHGPVALGSRPYRLLAPLDTDVAEVHRLLHRGAYRRALSSYPGPLLPESQAPGVETARERLRHELRACLIAGGDADLLWTYAQRPEAVDDLEIWQACLDALPPSSRRLPVVGARVRQLDDDLR